MPGYLWGKKKEFSIIIIFLINILFLNFIASFTDSQLPLACGGDSELIIGCLGDSGLLFVEGMPAPPITFIPTTPSPTAGGTIGPESEPEVPVFEKEQPKKPWDPLSSIYPFSDLSETGRLIVEIILTVFIMSLIAFGYMRRRRKDGIKLITETFK